MKYLKLTALLLGIVLVSCKTETKSSQKPDEKSTTSEEKEQLQDLTRQVYKWVETRSSGNDFSPIENFKDSTYPALDMKQHEKRMQELKASGYFADEFLDNYAKIALKIDKQLKNKTMVWEMGYMPPFGNDANPWCNCQDNPDDYWKKITIQNLSLDQDEATFSWTWEWDDFAYKARAKKENGAWKISYLEGFDLEEFTKID